MKDRSACLVLRLMLPEAGDVPKERTVGTATTSSIVTLPQSSTSLAFYTIAESVDPVNSTCKGRVHMSRLHAPTVTILSIGRTVARVALSNPRQIPRCREEEREEAAAVVVVDLRQRQFCIISMGEGEEVDLRHRRRLHCLLPYLGVEGEGEVLLLLILTILIFIHCIPHHLILLLRILLHPIYLRDLLRLLRLLSCHHLQVRRR